MTAWAALEARAKLMPGEVVNDVVTVLDVLGEERGISIVTKLPTPNSLVVTGDRSHIWSAIMNVVHNAIKFSPADSVVTVTHTADEERSIVALTIQDQGPGIQDSERKMVFVRFYTSAKRETVQHNGTGLGLSIAKLVVERSGEEIFFDGAEVTGAQRVIRLPVHKIGVKAEGVS